MKQMRRSAVGKKAKKPLLAPRQRSDATTETIAASVPKSIVAAVKRRTGKGGFSRFVAEAMERHLRYLALQEIIDDVVQDSGPLGSDEIAAARQVIRS